MRRLNHSFQLADASLNGKATNSTFRLFQQSSEIETQFNAQDLVASK